MILKLIGAVLVIAGAGGVGLMIASTHRKEVRALQNLLTAIDQISGELQYRLTPLPELCQLAAVHTGGVVKEFFIALTLELNKQLSPNAAKCAKAVLENLNTVPERTKALLSILGSSLGQLDATGQLKDLQSIRDKTENCLKHITSDQDAKLRSYQTLALCAGAALAILFV